MRNLFGPAAAWTLLVVALFLGLSACTRSGSLPDDVPEPEVLPDPARVVWVRQVVGNGDDPFATRESFVLMGRDLRDQTGERIILDELDNYHKPMFTGDGERIVYTDLPETNLFVVNWDGSGKRALGHGMAVEVWMDPETSVEWVYYSESYRTNTTLDGVGLMRRRLDEPERVERVWDRTDVTPDNFQLSADGKRASGLFPWKAWSILNLETMELEPYGKGCWTSMAPDNSYLGWVFDGAHKNVLLRQPGMDRAHRVPINTAPKTEGHEVYHPRWSNHPRYMTMTGPYRVMGRYNAILEGGKGINVYVGRFSEDMRAIEDWIQVSDHDNADFYPDLWVTASSDGSSATLTETMQEPQLSGGGGRVRVKARVVEISETPSLEAIKPYTSTLVEYVYDVVSVESGELEADRIVVQHWGIRKSEYVDLARSEGDIVSLVIEPIAAHPELEGERVSSTISEFALDVYLDVGGSDT